VRYVPHDTVASGKPANLISAAVQAGVRLSKSSLFLAGLILATGLHHHAWALLSSDERARIVQEIGEGLDAQLKMLIRSANDAVAVRTTLR
jgi:hypothetical protein